MGIVISRQSTVVNMVLDREKQLDVIFISSPTSPYAIHGSELIKQYARNCLELFFHDIDFVRDGHIAPAREHVEAALAFAKDKDDLIICCQAGVSRSSATAFIIAAARFTTADEALKILDHKTHWPNHLIVKHGAEILGKPELLTLIEQWKTVAQEHQQWR